MISYAKGTSFGVFILASPRSVLSGDQACNAAGCCPLYARSCRQPLIRKNSITKGVYMVGVSLSSIFTPKFKIPGRGPCFVMVDTRKCLPEALGSKIELGVE